MDFSEEYYENQKCKIEREISDLWECNKKSKAKERRLEEIDLILIGIQANERIEELRKEMRDLRYLLKKNNIEIPDDTEDRHRYNFEDILKEEE